MGISKNEGLKRLNNSVTCDRGKKGAFGGTYFRDIYSSNNERLNNSIKYR